MMKKLTAICVAAAQLTIALPSWADETKLPDPPALVNEPDPGSVITPMKKGDKAPYTGVLLSPKSTASILVQLKSVDERIKIEVNKARGDEKAQCTKATSDELAKHEADVKVLNASVEEKIKRIEFLEKKLDAEIKSHPNVALWTSLGVVGGIAVTSLTFYLVTQAVR